MPSNIKHGEDKIALGWFETRWFIYLFIYLRTQHSKQYKIHLHEANKRLHTYNYAHELYKNEN